MPIDHVTTSPEDSDVLSLDSNISRNNNINHENHDPVPLTEDGLKSAMKTNTNTTQASKNSATSSKVPRSKRRGLFANLSLVPEYTDARDYPKHIKLGITFIIALASAVGPMGTSILLPSLKDVASDLHTSTSMVNISVGVYLLSLGIFPLWWSAFSERHGRRSIYLISFGFLCGFSVGTALAPSIGILILFRVLCGSCSASVQAVGAGTIADLYIQQERGAAMGLYYLGPLCGPLLAPVLGGAIAIEWGWRGTQWFLVIFTGVIFLFLTVALPETLRVQDNAQAIRLLLQNRMKQVAEDEKSRDEESTIQNIEEHLEEQEAVTDEMTIDDESSQINEDGNLDRIMSHISQQASRREHEENHNVNDSFMPSASRINTNKSQLDEVQLSDYSKLKEEMKKYESLSKKSSNKAAPLTKRQQYWESFKVNVYIYGYQPLKALRLLSYPPVLLAILYSSPCFAVLYFVNMTISYEYARAPYNFKSVILGLIYLPNSVTYIIASIYGGKWTDRLLKSYAKKHNGLLVPESRISYNVVTAIAIFPGALLIIGWCLHYKEQWVTPLIGTAIFGFASMIIIGTTVTYLVDSLPGRGATGVALNNLFRMILAAIATFITEPLIKALGTGVLFSILAGVITLCSVNLLILKLHGKKWRDKIDLSKLYDSLE